MNDNLRQFFEKASADKNLKDRIISIYREYTVKDEIIDRLIILASEYEIILTPVDFRKQSETGSEYAAGSDFESSDLPDNVPEKTGEPKKSFFEKLFGRKQ